MSLQHCTANVDATKIFYTYDFFSDKYLEYFRFQRILCDDLKDNYKK